jgi:hypothetical protein
MLGIPPLNKILKKFLSFLDYFVENLYDTFIRSIDMCSAETYETQSLERWFILESMTQLRNYLNIADHPSRDYSDDYIM